MYKKSADCSRTASTRFVLQNTCLVVASGRQLYFPIQVVVLLFIRHNVGRPLSHVTVVGYAMNLAQHLFTIFRVQAEGKRGAHLSYVLVVASLVKSTGLCEFCLCVTSNVSFCWIIIR